MRLIDALLLSSLIFCSCEQILFEKDLTSSDPLTNFEYLWSECNEKYAYFDLKAVDWDSIKSTYSSQIFEDMSNDDLFQLLGAMLKELKDDHTNLISDFNISFYGVEYNAQDNFDWRLVVDHYITPNFYISGPFNHNFIKNENIAYIRYASFGNDILNENLDFIIQRYQNADGLILDIRENGGGKINNVFKLLSRFVDQSTMVNYTRIKNGPGHEDFSIPEPVYINPYDGSRYNGSVIVLTDRGTYSSGSLLALATKALPNIKLIGDDTGGGLGIPNGGQLPNGWTYRFSISQSLDLNLRPNFEQGVPADILVNLNLQDLDRDEILERAIEEFR